MARLAGFVQPLSGEYAGGQKLLEQVPFVSRYGVELSCWSTSPSWPASTRPPKSTWAPASTHQSDVALDRMAGQILQTALALRPGIAVGNDSLVQCVRTSVGVEPATWDVGVRERPPARWISSVTGVLADDEAGFADASARRARSGRLHGRSGPAVHSGCDGHGVRASLR